MVGSTFGFFPAPLASLRSPLAALVFATLVLSGSAQTSPADVKTSSALDAALGSAALDLSPPEFRAATKFEMFSNLRCSGDFKVYWNTPDVKTCQRRCDVEERCAMFSLEGGGGRGCFLFDKFGCTHDFNWISGRKRLDVDIGPYDFEPITGKRCAGRMIEVPGFPAWGTPSDDACKELCALHQDAVDGTKSCSLWARESTGGKGCFLYQPGYTCEFDGTRTWSAGRVRDPLLKTVKTVESNFTLTMGMRCNDHYSIPAWNTPSDVTCMEICQLDPLCQMWVQEPFGGRGCFTYRETFLCYAYPDWNAGQKITASRASCGQHFNLVQNVGGTLSLHGLGFLRDHEFAFVGADESCADPVALANQVCEYNPAAMKVSPDTTGLTLPEVKCHKLGTAKVCFRNHVDEETPMIEIGVIVVGINVFDQYLLDLDHLRTWIKENKDEKRFEDDTRGLVLCVGGPTLLTNAYVTISALRTLGCRLPIEIFHLGQEEISSIAKSILLQHFAGDLGEISFHDALEMEYPEGHETFHLGAKPVSADTLQGYMLKGFALLQSKFRHVMLFDADSGPIVNPTFLFDTPEYIRHGSMFWQDFWSGWVKDEFYGVLNITKPGNMVRDIEAGQFLMNKYRHWDVVLVTWFLNCHSEVTYLYQHGDKDTYPQAFDLLGKLNDFFVVPHAPRAAFMEADPPDGSLRLVGMLQPSLDGKESAFIHRTSTGKYQPYVDPTPIDWATEPGLLTVEYNRKYLVDQAGPLTLGLKMKWIPPGMLDRPSKILQWHQRIALSAYQSFRLMLLSFEKVIPKGMKKAKLKTLKCPGTKSGDFGWEKFDRACYKKVVVDYPNDMAALTTTGAAAEMICEADRGSSLVWVASLDEHDYIYDTASPNSDTWLGAMYALPNFPGRPIDPNLGWFHYNKKVPWNFTYWGPEQPANTNGSQLCLAIRKSEGSIDDNSWVVQNCSSKREVICKVAQAKVWDTKPGAGVPTVAPTMMPTVLVPISGAPTTAPNVGAPTAQCLVCPNSGWTLFGQQCYQSVFKAPMTFEAAELHCVTNNGHLATITSDGENSFLYDIGEAGYTMMWLGLHRIGAAPTAANGWKWTSGATVTTLAPFWSTGEPAAGKQCGAILRIEGDSRNGKWVAHDCAQKLAFVCETHAAKCGSVTLPPFAGPSVGEPGYTGDEPSDVVMFHPQLAFTKASGEVDYADSDKTDFTKPIVENNPELQLALRQTMAKVSSTKDFTVPVSDVVIQALIGDVPKSKAASDKHRRLAGAGSAADTNGDYKDGVDLEVHFNVTASKKMAGVMKEQIRQAVTGGSFLDGLKTNLVELLGPEGAAFLCCVTPILENPNMDSEPIPVKAITPAAVGCKKNAACPKGWTLHCNDCYRTSGIKAGSAEQVEAECALRSAHLPTVKSEQQHDFLHQLIGANQDTWVGLESTAAGNQWKDGTTIFSPYMHSLVAEGIPPFYTCQPGWKSYGARCYATLDGKSGTSEEMEAACEAKEANLAVPTDAAENSFLTQFLPNSRDFWIGLNYNAAKSRWQRYDNMGTTPSFGWSTKKMSNAHCAALHHQDGSLTNGQWIPTDCSKPMGAVCSRKAKVSTCFGLRSAEGDARDGSLVPASCTAHVNMGMCTKPATVREEVRACPLGWSNYAHNCYMLLPTTGASKAQDHGCAAIGGNLASIENDAENHFVHSVVLPGRDTWIGASFAFDQIEEAGDDFGWLWYDRTFWSFANWAKGHPKSIKTGSKICASMHHMQGASDDSAWITTDCERKLPAVCKRGANTTALALLNAASGKLLPTTAAGATVPPCKKGWTLFGRNCYSLTGSGSTWNEQELECDRLSTSHTASIASQQENDFVMSMVPQSSDVWIGLSYAFDAAKQSKLLGEHGWLWSDHIPPNFYHWATNEPSNPGAAKLCVALRNNEGDSKHASWVVADCNRHLRAICKEPATLSTEVTAALDKADANELLFTAPCSACAPGWSCQFGKCYKLLSTPAPRAAQEAKCASFGGHLVSAGTTVEEAYLYDLCPANQDVWIGASRAAALSAPWTWAHSGKATKITMWADAEPSKVADHRCAAIRRVEGSAKDGLWIALKCEAALPALCSSPLPKASAALAVPVASASADGSAPPCASNSCPLGWQCFEESCFKVTDTADTFEAHVAKCAASSPGAHLATVKSVGLEAVVHDLAPKGRDVWIGASRATDSDEWKWSHDATTIGNGFWAIGQPPMKSTSTLCAAIRTTQGDRADGLWIALACSSHLPAMCQVPRADAKAYAAVAPGTSPTFTFVAPCDDTSCEKGWTCFESSCYKLQAAGVSRAKQATMCTSTGGHLATVTTPAKELVLYDMCPRGQDVWIGATRSAGSAAWKWSSTSAPLVAPIWGTGEPASATSSVEGCAAIRRIEGDANDGLWVALKCSANLAALCEKQRTAEANAPTSLAGASDTGCPANWVRFQQACYLPVMARLSFAQAEKHCVAASAHLVSVRSFHEQEFVSRISSPWQDTWIGLSHGGPKDKWMWVDSGKWSFSNWGSKQPSSASAKCGALRRMEGNVNDATWVTPDCTREMHSICKKKTM